jgi:hypothetical protein
LLTGIDDTPKIADDKEHLAEQVTILRELRKKYKAEIKDLKQMISKGSFVTAEQISSKTDDSGNLLFEFSVGVEDIQQYMSSVTDNKGSLEILWFNGTLNKDMNKVIEICLHIQFIKKDISKDQIASRILLVP